MSAINKKIFQWAVLGAGPAGIAAVGKLLDNGIPADQILWCDPHFKVGDLGMYWSNVSSNTKVKLFTNFLYASQSFAYECIAANFDLYRLNPEETCTLKYVVEPLQWISNQLKKLVKSHHTIIHNMFLSERLWFLSNGIETYKTHNVILATGASPLSLNYPGVDVIPFEVAIDNKRLAQIVTLKDTYAVFGSSHSAIIILRYLVEMGVKKVINFYRSPCRYAIDMNDWVLFDNTGLKGQTAVWARNNIDGMVPENLVRYNTTKSQIAHLLPECNKIIYAVGFEKRKSIVIRDYENTPHDPYVGIIGPGLFGFGIAYPEFKADPFGSVESQVGLWKFMVYLNKVLPVWLKYHI